EIVERGQSQRIVPDCGRGDGLIERFGQLGEVHAGAEGAAGACEDDTARRGIIDGAQKGVVQRGDEAAADGVAPIGPVEGDDGGRRAQLIEGQRFAHCLFLTAGRCMSRRFSGEPMGIASRASARVLPWVSIRSERLAPPASTSYRTKFTASK